MPKESSFRQKLSAVARGLSTLRVRTCIGKIQAKQSGDAGEGMTGFSLEWKPEQTKILATEIDLVSGDANNFVDEDFLSEGPAAVMREFHERQVARAQDVVHRNVDLMIKLGTALVQELKDLKD